MPFYVIALTGTDIDDSGGMELCIEQWDYVDTNNLLDFCKLDADGRISGFGLLDAEHPHFFMTFTQENIAKMLERYEKLRSLLYSFIRQKEGEALKHFTGERYQLFPDECFARKITCR